LIVRGIVKYPEAVKIGGSAYHYFILWADEAHIEQISNTLTFLKKQIGAEKHLYRRDCKTRRRKPCYYNVFTKASFKSACLYSGTSGRI
jgi:hypothetical protein